MIGHKGLEIVEKTRTLLMLALVSALLNIGLNFALIPKFGYNGAAFAKFLSYLAYPIFVYWVTKPLIPWRIPWTSAARIVVGAAGMAGSMLLTVWLIPVSVPAIIRLFVAAIVGFPVYVGILLATRELNVKELRDFRS
jgi:O-antigen/teichoic acid export membrane protein